MAETFKIYIREQLARGYHPADLYDYMKSSHYDKNQLDQDFKDVLASDSLYIYIKNQLVHVPAKQLSGFLAEKGYDQKKVHFFLTLLQQKASKEHIMMKKEMMPMFIITGIAVVLLVVIISLILIFTGPEKKVTYDFSIQLAEDALEPTGQLAIQYSLYSSSDDKIPIIITHKILDVAKRPIQVINEDVSLQGSAASTSYYSLQDFAPGTYSVYSTASYNGVLRTAEKTFTVLAEERVVSSTPQDKIVEQQQREFTEEQKNGPESLVEQDNSALATVERISTPRLSQEGTAAGDLSADLEQVNQFAKPRQTVEKKGSIATMTTALEGTSFSKGSAYCQEFNDFQADNCYALLAKETLNHEACVKIADFLKKDECLLWMAIDKNDAHLCQLIQTADLTAECAVLQS